MTGHFGDGEFGSGTFGDPLEGGSAPAAEQLPSTPLPVGVLEVFNNGAWSDASVDLRRFVTDFGQDEALDQMKTGTATLVVDNRERQFERENTDSPYWPAIRYFPAFRLKANVDTGADGFAIGGSAMGGGDVLGGGVCVFSLFTGVAQVPTNQYHGADATVTIPLSDSFEVWRQATQPGYYFEGQLAGDRIAATLDQLSPAWPAGQRNIEPGIRMMDVGLRTTDCLTYMLQVATSEGGAFFVDGDGNATFFGADHAVFPDEVWGDAPGELRYRKDGFTRDLDRQLIHNSITVTAPNQADVVVSDPLSQSHFYGRDFTIDTLLQDPNDMFDVATEALDHYSRPLERIRSLELGAKDTDWIRVFRHQLLDQIIFRVRPPGGGVIEQLSQYRGRHIESNSRYDWRVRWSLSALGTPSSSSRFSFESGTTESWTVIANCALDVVTPGHFGQYALQLQPVAAGVPAIAESPDPQAVVPGMVYAAAAYAAGGDRGDAKLTMSNRIVRLDIVWRDVGGAVLAITEGDEIENVTPPLPGEGSPSYTFVLCQAEAPVGAATAAIRIVMPRPSIGGFSPVFADQVAFSGDV